MQGQVFRPCNALGPTSNCNQELSSWLGRFRPFRSVHLSRSIVTTFCQHTLEWMGVQSRKRTAVRQKKYLSCLTFQMRAPSANSMGPELEFKTVSLAQSVLTVKMIAKQPGLLQAKLLHGLQFIQMGFCRAGFCKAGLVELALTLQRWYDALQSIPSQ